MSLNHIWQPLSKYRPFLSFSSGDVSGKVLAYTYYYSKGRDLPCSRIWLSNSARQAPVSNACICIVVSGRHAHAYTYVHCAQRDIP